MPAHQIHTCSVPNTYTLYVWITTLEGTVHSAAGDCVEEMQEHQDHHRRAVGKRKRDEKRSGLVPATFLISWFVYVMLFC